MLERIVVHILPRHFHAFQKLMPNDERVRGTYKEWKQRRDEDVRAGGGTATQVTVTPKEFEVYCLQLGQVPNYSVLQALGTAKARGPT